MKKRRRTDSSVSINKDAFTENPEETIGIVLSGGGSRAAYQAGALKALSSYFKEQKDAKWVIMGSSIGAINGLLFGAGLSKGIDESIFEIEKLWKERTFKNTFRGSPSMAFLRAIKVAILQYMSPGPNPSSDAVFDPSPLQESIDDVLNMFGGLSLSSRAESIKAIGTMTTMEGEKRKPLLFLSADRNIPEDDAILEGASFSVYNVRNLTSKHGFASAALPSILPPVEMDTAEGKITLVDGGISSNIPVDPAVRLGASKVIIIDVSGRLFWLKKYGQPPDKRPDWEVPSGMETFCLRPPDTFNIRNVAPMGPVLKAAVGSSTSKFITAVGPTWPIFTLLKNKLGEDVAYETMTYVALDRDFLEAIIELGYTETRKMLRNMKEPEFGRAKDFKDWAEEVNKE